jgi:beta-lactamase class A
VISRRELLFGAIAAAPALMSRYAFGDDSDPTHAIADLERKYGGRLGVAILDTSITKTIAHRGDERFPMCSTFKFLAAALLLTRVDRRKESLDRRIIYKRGDLVAHSPTTEKHLADGMTMREICAAALTLSDNTAANLMLDSFGGPPGVTAFARSLGDEVTRLDRREPALNEAAPGDPRDTTTPRAMLELMRKIVLGRALSAASREQLIAWMTANQTGGRRLRAGVPRGWRVADKTGSGAHNTTNDIAVIWPPGRAPILLTAYYTEANASDAECETILREVGRLATSR